MNNFFSFLVVKKKTNLNKCLNFADFSQQQGYISEGRWRVNNINPEMWESIFTIIFSLSLLFSFFSSFEIFLILYPSIYFIPYLWRAMLSVGDW